MSNVVGGFYLLKVCCYGIELGTSYTNQSTVSGRIWTNESAPLCVTTLTRVCVDQMLELEMRRVGSSTILSLRDFHPAISRLESRDHQEFFWCQPAD